MRRVEAEEEKRHSWLARASSHVEKGIMSVKSAVPTVTTTAHTQQQQQQQQEHSQQSGSSSTNAVAAAAGSGPVVKQGYLRKLKTWKKKYFVLRAETCDSSARLEYYDSEKKFNGGHQAPKRCIPIKTCFNINKRNDTKHKHVIALYTKDDCFCVVLDTEDELDAWLKALLSQQQGEAVPRPTFAHIFQVRLLNRGVTHMVPGYKPNENTMGHRLCLTDKTLSLIRQDCDASQADFPLSILRSCGSLRHYFYLEAGRSSIIGAGEIWMEAEDPNIAQNINRTVYNAMTNSSNSSREELGPKARNRSSSATETSKPTSVHRRQTMASGTPKPIPPQQQHQYQQQQQQQQQDQTVVVCTNVNMEIPTSNVNNINSTSSATTSGAGNLAWPGIIVNHQRTRSLPLAHPAPITTDNPLHPPAARAATKRSTQSSTKCFTDTRGRCDSMPMPTRPRTTSEGNHPIVLMERPPWMGHKHSNRDISHSPPSDSPLSPHSGACSTDSAGSSLSIDDNLDNWHDSDLHRGGGGRFNISLTPDEAIAEENCDDCADSPCRHHISPTPSTYVPMAPISSDDGYVDMSPRGRHITMSPAASMSSVTSGTPSTEEEETSSAERPRTYSMGSKPYRNRIMDQPRNRACSVGSKSKKGYNRVLPPHGPQGQHCNTKSSSAPILSNKNSRPHSSHSSIGPMDDLMELDFSKKTAATDTTSSAAGYMNMKPANNRVPFGYVEMRPGHIEKPSTTDKTPYVEMRPGSSPAKAVFEAPKSQDYMDMEGRRFKPSPPQTHPSLSPLSSVASTSPLSQYTPTTDYIDMNFQTKSQSDHYMASPARSIMSHLWRSSASIDYIDVDYQATVVPTTTITTSSTTTTASKAENEGYVEMSPALPVGGATKNCNTTGDYTNMNLGSNKKTDGKKTGTTTENRRSKPINIQPSRNLINDAVNRGRMFLPLSRQRSRKNSRRDSKDSSSSSVVTTPSSSSTIFPLSLNSPSSPVDAAAKSPAAAAVADNKAYSIMVPHSVLAAKYEPRSNKRNEDYTRMDYEPRKPQPQNEYVNFQPQSTMSSHTQPPSSEQPNLGCKVTSIRLIDDTSRCFKPIDEETQSKLSRPSSESSEVSTIVGDSRPESVNSVLINADSPGSGQTTLHYASLDLEEPNSSIANNNNNNKKCKNTDTNETGKFSYAKIDFERSHHQQQQSDEKN